MAKKRIERDFYPTPSWCIKGFMDLIELRDGDVLSEPCIGNRQIANEFPESHEYKWAELSHGVDYLNPNRDMSADVIITNPPFSLFMDFIRTGLERDLSKFGTMAFLLRLSVKGSKDRADFWREFPHTHEIILTPRPSFAHGGTDNSEYAWFVWDFGNRMKCPSHWNIKKHEYL